MSAKDETGRRQRRVLVIGPMAPAVGGMATVVDQLLEGPLTRSLEFIRRPANAATEERRSFCRSVRRHAGQLAGLAACLNRDNIDLVHIHTCSGFTFHRNLLDASVARLFGVPVVLHIHGAQFDAFYGSAGGIVRRRIRRGLTLADRVVVLSRHWRSALREFAPDASYSIVPNGVMVPPSVPESEDAEPRQPCRFLFLASICRRKGIDVLLKAARALTQGEVPFHLTVAGPEEEPGEAAWLRQEITRCGLGGCVEYAGTVTGREKDVQLERCDCMVLPSRAEGLPLTLLEAGACGRAVVVTAVGAVPEVVSDDSVGLVVSPGDETALAQAMETVGRDPARRRAMGRALRSRVRDHYSLERQSELIADVYGELWSAPRKTGDRSWAVVKEQPA